ncbi:MAG: hypothetical protein FWH23_01530 [Bacteroidales bacterium]|nr:hypothetical protein [Bacteroidales bacterium]MCL2133166.1 hypothetical protein [Bacteroidales bacterium]
MKKVIFIVLTVSALLALNSCEWVNTTVLGNPSKEKIAADLARENALKDSLTRAAQDCAEQLAALQQAQGSANIKTNIKYVADPGQRYHIIVGCFLMEENAAGMMSLLRSNGYQPIEFSFKNGYACISSQAFNNMSDAFDAMSDMLRYNDFCPDDVWVYDTAEQLHR